MIHLPDSPFPISFLEEEDEFVQEALRRRNYSEPCWCGSSLPYKKCHRVRKSLRPLELNQLLNEQNKVFWQSRNCMHPETSPETCKGKVIDSHTIQRKGPLASIIDESNHVSKIDIKFGTTQFEAVDIGWRKASVFPGFCSYHDTELFSELEQLPFAGTHEQCVLQSFRNVCNELYKKRALMDSLIYQSSVIDRGKDLDTQIGMQKSMQVGIANQCKAIEELEYLWNLHNTAIQSRNFDLFESKTYPFRGDISVVSAAAIQVDFDFEGNQFCDLFDPNNDAESICYCILNTEEGGALMFCWPTDFKAPSDFVSSFDKIDDLEKSDIFAQYCFVSSEHTFFSRDWWEGLNDEQKGRIFELYACTYYEGGKFEVSSSRLLNWEFY